MSVSAPVVVTAERLDRPGTGPSTTVPVPALPGSGGPGSGGPGAGSGGSSSGSGGSGSGGSGSGGAAALPVSGAPATPDRRRSDAVPALPPGFSSTASRVNPNLADDEPVYVPSRATDPPAAPRRAEMEEVAGRPVWVVYRPSAGLEVNDGDRPRNAD